MCNCPVGVPLTVNNKHVSVYDTENEISNITIKDLPVEISDEFTIANLARYGKIVQSSLNQSLYRGTSIETGSKMASLLQVENVIPNEAVWGRYTVRVYCDNKKCACIYFSTSAQQEQTLLPMQFAKPHPEGLSIKPQKPLSSTESALLPSMVKVTCSLTCID